MTPPLAEPLRQLADFAEIRGNSLEAAGWRFLAGELVGSPDADLARLRNAAARGVLAERVPIDPALRITLEQLLVEGPGPVVTRGLATLPLLVRTLLDMGAVSASTAATLARHGILTLQDLESGLDDGRVATHAPGSLDPLNLAAETMTATVPPVPLGRAVDLIENLGALIAAAAPEITSLTAAGGMRRFEPLVPALALVGAAPDPPASLERLCAMPQVQLVTHRSARRALIVYQHLEVDVRIAASDELGTTLFVATGSRAHLRGMRQRQRGMRLSAQEQDVYAQAGLSWIAPELRHGTGEIETAAGGTLPRLVVREDIRGDLHMHTTYSDGRDTLVEMVQTCAGLGYEYIAITDHSERSAAMRTLSPAALQRQRDEIARLQDRFPDMTILHGVEVDIMPDGSLDFPDRLLEPLDIVLASLHDRAGHDARELTRRCLAAIAHPLVNVITHPANQLVGQHPGYDMDFDAVYAAAAESGTALEVDGAPSHLDMDGEHARAAVAAGVTVTIDSDCHRARLLDKQMQLGIGTARRGWVEARHVLNTRPLADVRAFVAAKRRARS